MPPRVETMDNPHLMEERLRGILDALPQGVVLIDAAGVVTFVNARAAEIFGFLPSILIGKNGSHVLPLDFLHDVSTKHSPESLPGTRTRVVVFRKTGRPDVTQEVQIHHFRERGKRLPSTLVCISDVPTGDNAGASKQLLE